MFFSNDHLYCFRLWLLSFGFKGEEETMGKQSAWERSNEYDKEEAKKEANKLIRFVSRSLHQNKTVLAAPSIRF
jgi:hypothetical protein